MVYSRKNEMLFRRNNKWFVIHRWWFRSDHTSSAWFHLQNWGSIVSPPGQTTHSRSCLTQSGKGHDSWASRFWSVCSAVFVGKGLENRTFGVCEGVLYHEDHATSYLFLTWLLRLSFKGVVWFQAHSEVGRPLMKYHVYYCVVNAVTLLKIPFRSLVKNNVEYSTFALFDWNLIPAFFKENIYGEYIF